MDKREVLAVVQGALDCEIEYMGRCLKERDICLAKMAPFCAERNNNMSEMCRARMQAFRMILADLDSLDD